MLRPRDVRFGNGPPHSRRLVPVRLDAYDWWAQSRIKRRQASSIQWAAQQPQMTRTVSDEETGETSPDETSDDVERRINDRRRLVLMVDAAMDPKPSSAPRRSGKERRSEDRRRATRSARAKQRSADRRTGERRAEKNRREPGDRRGRGPAVFTVEEASLIVEDARKPGPVACPRCRNPLTLRPPVASESRSVWVVHCSTCRCRLRIENL